MMLFFTIDILVSQCNFNDLNIFLRYHRIAQTGIQHNLSWFNFHRFIWSFKFKTTHWNCPTFINQLSPRNIFFFGSIMCIVINVITSKNDFSSWTIAFGQEKTESCTALTDETWQIWITFSIEWWESSNSTKSILPNIIGFINSNKTDIFDTICTCLIKAYLILWNLTCDTTRPIWLAFSLTCTFKWAWCCDLKFILFASFASIS